jgi:RNA polymerase sigma-70 factor (ECF subfamily)
MPQQTIQLLQRLREGDGAASEELMELLYGELHRIAVQRLRHERPDHTLQPTALVNEAYVKIFDPANSQFTDRAHFLAFASRIMRHILVDYARERGAEKRGGHDQRTTIKPGMDVAIQGVDEAVQLLDLDRAIESLAVDSPFPAQVIEMRYFGGMTAEETAEAVGRSVHVVRHELRYAHAWLRRKLSAAC